MSDIAKRLRDRAHISRIAGLTTEATRRALFDAADEIERLRAERDKWRRVAVMTSDEETKELRAENELLRDSSAMIAAYDQAIEERDEARTTATELRGDLEVEYALRDALSEEVTDAQTAIALLVDTWKAIGIRAGASIGSLTSIDCTAIPPEGTSSMWVPRNEWAVWCRLLASLPKPAPVIGRFGSSEYIKVIPKGAIRLPKPDNTK